MTSLTDDQRQEFQRDGVTVVRNVLGADWLDRLAKAIDENMANPGPHGKNHAEDGGAYFGDYVNWKRIPDFIRAADEGPLGELAAELMAACGYPETDCRRVQTILSKRELRHDADTQLLEDVACMVFLEKYFAGFYEQKADYDRSKWLRILRRTWDKMSPRGQQAALALAAGLPAHLQALLQEAVAAEAG